MAFKSICLGLRCFLCSESPSIPKSCITTHYLFHKHLQYSAEGALFWAPSSLVISINSVFWIVDCLISKLPTSAGVAAICHRSKIVQIPSTERGFMSWSLFTKRLDSPEQAEELRINILFLQPFLVTDSIFCIMCFFLCLSIYWPDSWSTPGHLLDFKQLYSVSR